MYINLCWHPSCWYCTIIAITRTLQPTTWVITSSDMYHRSIEMNLRNLCLISSIFSIWNVRQHTKVSSLWKCTTKPLLWSTWAYLSMRTFKYNYAWKPSYGIYVEILVVSGYVNFTQCTWPFPEIEFIYQTYVRELSWEYGLVIQGCNCVTAIRKIN